MLAYVEAVTNARTMEDVWPIHCAAMAEFGFNRLLYGMTRTSAGESYGNKEDFLILTNMSEEYTGPFIDQGMFKHAPMMRWVLTSTGGQSWNWPRKNAIDLSVKEKEVLAFNDIHDIRSGYSVSFKGVDPRSVAAIALIADGSVSQEECDAMWEKHGASIVAMNNVLHLKIMQLPGHSVRKELTHRQRESLEWVGKGKTTQDIGIIMGLTQATVEKHLRLARESLDVETTAQAVVKAAFQNQIFMLEGV